MRKTLKVWVVSILILILTTGSVVASDSYKPSDFTQLKYWYIISAYEKTKMIDDNKGVYEKHLADAQISTALSQENKEKMVAVLKENIDYCNKIMNILIERQMAMIDTKDEKALKAIGDYTLKLKIEPIEYKSILK